MKLLPPLNQVCENDETPQAEKLVMVLENDNKETCQTPPLGGEQTMTMMQTIAMSRYHQIESNHRPFHHARKFTFAMVYMCLDSY